MTYVCLGTCVGLTIAGLLIIGLQLDRQKRRRR